MLTHTQPSYHRIARFPLLPAGGQRTVVDENKNGRFDEHLGSSRFTHEPLIKLDLDALKDYAELNPGIRTISKETFGEIGMAARVVHKTVSNRPGKHSDVGTAYRLSNIRSLTELANDMNPLPGRFDNLDWIIDLGNTETSHAWLYLVQKNTGEG